MGSRGKLRERNWRTSDDKHATIDDISVFVIPLRPYQEEHRTWKARQGRPPVGEESVVGHKTVASNNGHMPSLVPPGKQDNPESSGKHSTQEGLTTCMEAFDLHPQEDHFRSEVDTAQTESSEGPAPSPNTT